MKKIIISFMLTSLAAMSAAQPKTALATPLAKSMAIDPLHRTQVKVGLMSIGLKAYWPQFPGLQQRLEGYSKAIGQKLQACGAELVDAGMVDSLERAQQAAELLKTKEVRLLFLYVSTYALSATVLPVVQQAKIPVVVLNLQPAKAIDYAWFNALPDRGRMTGEWLAYCQACALPEIAAVFSRSAIPFQEVTGFIDDPDAWKEINEWVEAAAVAQVMARNRLGILGHYYNGMLDVYSDPSQQTIFFGSAIEHIEIGAIRDLRRQVSPAEVAAKIAQMRSAFQVSTDCAEAEIERAARTACSLDKLVEQKNLGSLAYYYEGSPGSEEEDIITSVIAGNSLLTARGVPVAGEGEVKNVQAMKILDAFGAGGSFSEFYAMDFHDDVILMGHDGPGHLAIAEGKPILKPLGVYHGKPGKGLSVEMKVKQGPVTLLAVVATREGKLKLLAAEGESVPGPILEIGNTNSRYKFPLGVKGFMDSWCRQGPAHHCAIGIGHIASKLKKLSVLLGLEFVQV